MQTLANPNIFSQVKVLTNPLKSVTCKHTFTNKQTIGECKLFPELLDLACGVWQVAVQSVLVRNNVEGTTLDTVFDLKTNLTSSYKQVSGQAIAVNETLCSLGVNHAYGGYTLYDPPAKLFFTLNNRPSDTFRVFFFENECIIGEACKAYKVEVEIRFLFQRML